MDNLQHLMAAYFHQDWWEEYGGSWHAAVRDFERRAPERVPALIDEISTVLSSGVHEGQAEKLLEDMGNYRSPGPGESSHLEWLADIRLLLIQNRDEASS